MNIRMIGLFLLFFVLAIPLISLMARLDHAVFPHSQGPGAITIAGVGLIFSSLTFLILYMYYKGTGMAPGFFISALAYNLLIVLVKTLSPVAVYEVNKDMAFDCSYFATPFGFILISVGIFLIYFAVFFAFYSYYKHKIRHETSPRKSRIKAKTIVGIVGGLLLAGLMFTSGSIPILLLFIVGGGSINYLGILSGSSLSIAIALALIGAILFLRSAYKNSAEQAIKLRNAGILSAFFWIGAGLLFMYSALWVVYLAALISLWPLRTVCPK
jgi:hypothetical protein